MTSTSPNHSLGSALSSLGPKWGWAVALGAALVVCGIIALLSLVVATAVTVIWVGAMMIIAGVAEIVQGYRLKGSWGRSILWMITGAFYIIGGFFAVVNPLLASVVLTLILAIALIIAGGVRTWMGFQLKGEGHSWVILSGILTLLFGLIILIHWPFSSLYALGIILGVDLIQTGAGWMHLGFFLKRHRTHGLA
jgi:uncharacterized membrane protein HdeD (DUF308 family)